MVTRTRLASKTIWALEDILALCQDARKAWQRAMRQVEKGMDPIMMGSLAVIRDRLAEVERKARDARAGDYRE